MLRRNVVAAASLLPIAALASGAFAQDADPSPTSPVDGSDAEMGEAEMTHAQQTGMIGSLSLLQSRLAATMASDEKVKMFAGWEVVEQETIGDILKSMKAGAEQAEGALAPP